MEHTKKEAASDAALFIEVLSCTRFADCYQCGKCTAGCPVAGQADVTPNGLIRLLQLGHAEEALRSKSIWQCVSCQTCTARCPKSVDCAAVMDALRQVALERDFFSKDQQRIVIFQKAFLKNIRRNGRLQEIELIAAFKTETFLKSGRIAGLFESAGLVPALHKRKKLHLAGPKPRDRAVIGRIFERCRNQELQ